MKNSNQQGLPHVYKIGDASSDDLGIYRWVVQKYLPGFTENESVFDIITLPYGSTWKQICSNCHYKFAISALESSIFPGLEKNVDKTV